MTNKPGAPVIHVASHYPPFLGGTEKVVESLALAQSQQGWSVHVLTSRDSRSLGDGTPARTMCSGSRPGT